MMNKKTTSISKNEFARLFAKEYDYTIKDANIVLDEFLELLVATVENDIEIKFDGFGKFFKKHRPGRTVKHPVTHMPTETKASELMAFKCGITVKERLTHGANKKW